MKSRAKVELGSCKHGVYTHSPKDPNSDICLKTNNEGFLQKTCWYSRAQSRKLWWLNNRRSQKFSVKKVNRGTIIDLPWWYKMWPLSGYNPTHVKQKLLRRPRRALWNSWSRQGNQKSFTLTIPWNSAKLVKTYPGNIVRQRHTDQKQMNGRKAVRRVKEGTSAVLSQSGLDKERWGGFHGMLLLSAKHSRSHVWWEDTIWEAVRNAL